MTASVLGILDRYLARQVIGATLLVALLLVALSAFLQLLAQLDALTGDYGLVEAFHFVLLSAPQQLYEMLPMAVLLGSLIGLGQLSSANELMVMRAAGVSILRLARGALLGGAIIALAAFLIGEFVAPSAEQYARSMKSIARMQRVTWLGASGVWARDGHRFVNVRQMLREDELRDVFVYELDDNGELQRMLAADEAHIGSDGWQLRDISITGFTTGGVETRRVERASWETLLSPSLLRLFVVDPDTLSMQGLVRYIGYLERNGLETQRFEQAFWIKLVAPLSVLVMVLLAVPFVFGPMRSVGQGQRVIFGVLIGVGFYVFNLTLAQSGLVFGLNPFVSAWLPTVLFAIGSVVALLRVR
ncbi:MAG TPA: LPS export ABC transporter permease LptG [Gammaproteobacteria bacterium]